MIEENKEIKHTGAMKKKKKKKSIIKELIIITIFFILVVALVAVSIAYQKEKNKKITVKDIQALQQQEVGMVLDEIGKHILLPEGVTPTIATITNVENLRKEMPFFDKAQNGFKVVVYEDKAILFDPVNQIIVDVAPVYQQNNDMGAIQQQSEEIQQESADKAMSDDTDKDLEKESADSEEKIDEGEDKKTDNSDESINKSENDKSDDENDK